MRAGWFFVNSEGSRYLTFFPVENVPSSTGSTFEPYACFCIAIAAAFPWFWGLVELDLSPRDSPKGLCNISRDQKGWYCGHTSRPKMSDISGSKVDFKLYHRCPDHDSRKCSAQLGSSWVLVGSRLVHHHVVIIWSGWWRTGEWTLQLWCDRHDKALERLNFYFSTT